MPLSVRTAGSWLLLRQPAHVCLGPWQLAGLVLGWHLSALQQRGGSKQEGSWAGSSVQQVPERGRSALAGSCGDPAGCSRGGVSWGVMPGVGRSACLWEWAVLWCSRIGRGGSLGSGGGESWGLGARTPGFNSWPLTLCSLGQVQFPVRCLSFSMCRAGPILTQPPGSGASRTPCEGWETPTTADAGTERGGACWGTVCAPCG